jgi:hypothetical protein
MAQRWSIAEVKMKRVLCILAAITMWLSVIVSADPSFEEHFVDQTLRIDFHHTGNAEHEFIAIDRLYRQGAWAGPLTRLIDPFGYGGYVVQVRDPKSGALLFSKRFDSYFGEYRTTAAAAEGTLRTYHESVLMPLPKHPIKVSWKAERRDGTELELAETIIDPASIAIATEPHAADVLVIESHVGGPPHEVLDVAILGEGYTRDEIEMFKKDVERATDVLLGQVPYANHRDRISVRGVLSPSAESGCDEPTRGTFRSTSLGATFNSLGSERYLLTEDNRALRDVAAAVAYDALVIMINHGRYGGGGIYNLFCTFTAHSEWADYLLLHEFGHSFAGLADEYYSSSTAYNDFYPRGHEPADPNITALIDPEDLKWRDLVEPDTEVPTPWEKRGYDQEDAEYQQERRIMNQAIAEASRSGESPERIAELEEYQERHAAIHSVWAEEYLKRSRWAGTVGAFEGAGYSSTGLYRPTLDCLMFSRRLQPLCPVCERAVEAMILRYTGQAPAPGTD